MDRTPSSSTSRALTVPSKPQVSLSRQNVLEEDEYTEALSNIIARDFFPSLAQLDATNNYLSALESEDPLLIRKSARILTELATAPTPTPRYRGDNRTPYVNFPSDTPLNFSARDGTDQPPSKKPRYNENLSLDQFQARYTSEDNASFTEILDDENRKRKEKHAWAWNAEDRAGMRRAKEIEARQRMMIEASEINDSAAAARKVITSGEEVKTITQNGEPEDKKGKGKAKAAETDSDGSEDGEMQHAVVAEQESSSVEAGGGQLILRENKDEDMDSEEPVDVMAPSKDKRSAGVPGWKFKTRNALMFPPDADVSPYQANQSELLTEGTRVEAPTIVHANTRLPEQSERAEGSVAGSSVPPSPTRSRIAAAISGLSYVPSTDSPKVRGFGFVDAIPSPSPSQLGAQGMKELMTLGTLLATPRVISGSDDPAEETATSSPFVIKPPNSRDMLGRRLGNEAGRSLTKKAGLLGGTTPRTPGDGIDKRGNLTTSTPRRVDILTPAARRLLSRTKEGAGYGPPIDSPRERGGLLGGLTPGGERRRPGKQLDLRKVGWDSPRGGR
ncbi:hypothetical protein M407DRAFT_19136 [Tulasnella calospora MUT 4182]|uniref:Nuclear protein DGCR14 n=1 Tax=Tulasnella calospora MUT 4182 TaxID=1051891 RepID=A0A0C3QU45_9AGAM|nr:hypothetical protein M407DRAFT_19136 [Tulasnella calospora MUT 4182]